MKIKDLESLTLKHQNSIKDVNTAVQHIDMSNKQLKGDDDVNGDDDVIDDDDVVDEDEDDDDDNNDDDDEE